ncbi:MAG: cupin-like domain-containing protein [Novosphingobium sp.]|jgi:hypothetical protein|nr:cupin-like domain-containing protein [Novosphingobium sp.]
MPKSSRSPSSPPASPERRELTAYLHPGWAPLIRPAPATRPWMDATPQSFAYRCLPLNIANAHGWEVLAPCGFEAEWSGGAEPAAVTIRPDDAGANTRHMPEALFGSGIITFHIEAIMRTPPGWNLWVGGSPNRAKDGIAPLGGVIETDWSPFTFTMNWRFTRPNLPVRFEAMEPFCFLFPVQRGALESFDPVFAPLDADPATAGRFAAWSKARDAFHARIRAEPPAKTGDHWQKHYYRGVDVSGEALVDDHQSKLRLKPFDRSAAPDLPVPPPDDPPVAAAPAPAPAQATAPAVSGADAREAAALRLALAKREWLLETLERQRDLAPALKRIERRRGVGRQEFLERYYALNRPVILAGEMDGWPALGWTPDILKARIGSAVIEYQGGRAANPLFEMEKDRHRREAPFDAFIDAITQGSGNDAYLTAFNSARNRKALAPLDQDMGFLDKFLSRESDFPHGMPWIGPAGTLTAMHHDLTNNFIAQIVGRKRLRILPASEAGRLYNRIHVFSEIPDIERPGLDGARYPRLNGARVFDITLEPGDILFMPLAWWHQVRALDFSVTATYTNFLWPNNASATYPQG